MRDPSSPAFKGMTSGAGFPGLSALLFFAFRVAAVVFLSRVLGLSLWVTLLILLPVASVFILGLVFAALTTPRKKPYRQRP